MPESVPVTPHSLHRKSENSSRFELDPAKSMDYRAYGGAVSKPSEFNGIQKTGYDIHDSELRYRNGLSIGTGSGGSGVGGAGTRSVLVSEHARSLGDQVGESKVPNIAPLDSRKDTYGKGLRMTRAVSKKPEGIGESLAWLKRELMDLRQTDGELMKTLYNLQTKIHDLKMKINQDEGDDDDDESEKTDSTSWSPDSSLQLNGSVSTPSSKLKGIKAIVEEDEPVELDKVRIDIKPARTTQNLNVVNRNVTNGNAVDRTAVTGNAVNGTVVNENAINHNVNVYSRNTNNSLNQQAVKAEFSSTRKVSATTSYSSRSQNANDYKSLEKPSLPPPPPPPASASPTPSLKSTGSSDILRFVIKDANKRDSMSSSSYVSSNSSFASSLEELRMSDESRELKSNRRSFDPVPYDEEELEETTEEADRPYSVDNENDAGNGNEDDTVASTTEAALWMNSIWEEATSSLLS
ncbi:uncharacterized protein [Diadema antillarum]|uniref:uncharacterized protein n=1 Tax=Diadema antillarum TaxID=105358 RepID=UPI003A87F09C